MEGGRHGDAEREDKEGENFEMVILKCGDISNVDISNVDISNVDISKVAIVEKGGASILMYQINHNNFQA